MSIELTCVRSVGELVSLIPKWNALLEKSKEATPFQMPEWVLGWWEHFGNDGLEAAAVYDGDRLVGLGLFFIYNESSVRKLCFISSGISDYLGLIVHPDYHTEVLAKVMEFLSCSTKWDQCDFQELQKRAALLELPQFSGIRIQRSVQSVCPCVVLPRNPNALLKSVPKNMEKNIRRSLNRAGKMGGDRFEKADMNTYEEFMNDLIRLHGERWKSRSEKGVLSGESLRKFYMSAGICFLKRGILDLYRLRIADKTSAVCFFFTYKRRTYAYLGGFDPEMEYCSPGTLALYFSMRDAVQRGSEVFDFLRGSESYKYFWGAKDRNNYRMLLERRR
ncbi:MAG: GNAT family N-acetyltransferase [Chitinispirillaceae bacterium]